MKSFDHIRQKYLIRSSLEREYSSYFLEHKDDKVFLANVFYVLSKIAELAYESVYPSDATPPFVDIEHLPSEIKNLLSKLKTGTINANGDIALINALLQKETNRIIDLFTNTDLTENGCLDLSGHNITFIPDRVLSMPKVQQATSINLSNNHLIKFPEKLLELNALRSIDVRGNENLFFYEAQPTSKTCQIIFKEVAKTEDTPVASATTVWNHAAKTVVPTFMRDGPLKTFSKKDYKLEEFTQEEQKKIAKLGVKKSVEETEDPEITSMKKHCKEADVFYVIDDPNDILDGIDVHFDPDDLEKATSLSLQSEHDDTEDHVKLTHEQNFSEQESIESKPEEQEIESKAEEQALETHNSVEDKSGVNKRQEVHGTISDSTQALSTYKQYRRNALVMTIGTALIVGVGTGGLVGYLIAAFTELNPWVLGTVLGLVACQFTTILGLGLASVMRPKFSADKQTTTDAKLQVTTAASTQVEYDLELGVIQKSRLPLFKGYMETRKPPVDRQQTFGNQKKFGKKN